MNCEDVAMQFLVANASHSPPLFVRGDVRDRGGFGGISTKDNHMVSRSLAPFLPHSLCLSLLSLRSSGFLSLCRCTTLLIHSITIDPTPNSFIILTTHPPPRTLSLLRSDCLNDMVRLFGGEDPLVTSHSVLARVGSWPANQPATWMEYFASDLPVPIPVQVALVLALLLAFLRGLWLLLRAVRSSLSASGIREKLHHPKT